MKIVDETSRAWTVECEAKGCHVKIMVPKRIKTAEGKTILADKPKQRWCASHPPGSSAK
jgi:hypothetical protein